MGLVPGRRSVPVVPGREGRCPHRRRRSSRRHGRRRPPHGGGSSGRRIPRGRADRGRRRADPGPARRPPPAGLVTRRCIPDGRLQQALPGVHGLPAAGPGTAVTRRACPSPWARSPRRTPHGNSSGSCATSEVPTGRAGCSPAAPSPDMAERPSHTTAGTGRSPSVVLRAGRPPGDGNRWGHPRPAAAPLPLRAACRVLPGPTGQPPGHSLDAPAQDEVPRCILPIGNLLRDPLRIPLLQCAPRSSFCEGSNSPVRRRPVPGAAGTRSRSRPLHGDQLVEECLPGGVLPSLLLADTAGHLDRLVDPLDAHVFADDGHRAPGS